MCKSFVLEDLCILCFNLLDLCSTSPPPLPTDKHENRSPTANQMLAQHRREPSLPAEGNSLLTQQPGIHMALLSLSPLAQETQSDTPQTSPQGRESSYGPAHSSLPLKDPHLRASRMPLNKQELCPCKDSACPSWVNRCLSAQQSQHSSSQLVVSALNPYLIQWQALERSQREDKLDPTLHLNVFI